VGFDPNLPVVDSLLTDLGLESVGYIQTIRNGLWLDLPIGSVSGNIRTTLSRIGTIASAYNLPNTGLTGQSIALGAVVATMNAITTVSGGYRVGGSSYGSTLDWFISFPKRLLDIVALMHDQLTPGQVQSYIAPVGHFVQGERTEEKSPTEATNVGRAVILHGVLGRDSARLTAGRDPVAQAFPYVTAGDGFYRDGSFIYHGNVPYTGSYGAVLLSNVAALFRMLRNSPWSFSSADPDNMFAAVDNAYAPFIYNGIAMDGVAGRAIAREGAHDHERARGMMGDILLLAESASSAQRSRWRSIVKGWFERDGWYSLEQFPLTSVVEAARVDSLMKDTSVVALAEPVRCQLFAGMDRIVHRRPNWALSISMDSTRTTFFEHGNGENLRGWHTNNGMTYWCFDRPLEDPIFVWRQWKGTTFVPFEPPAIGESVTLPAADSLRVTLVPFDSRMPAPADPSFSSEPTVRHARATPSS